MTQEREIKLPPLPSLPRLRTFVAGFEPDEYYLNEWANSHARAAVEADRQQAVKPVLHDIDAGIEVMGWLRENGAPYGIYAKMSACLFGDPDKKPRHSTPVEPMLDTPAKPSNSGELKPAASAEHVECECNCPGGLKPANAHAPNCPVRQRGAHLLDPYDGGTWLAPVAAQAQPVVNQSTEHEAFTDWCDRNEYDRAQRLDGSGYNNPATARAWAAWQAALAQQPSAKLQNEQQNIHEIIPAQPSAQDQEDAERMAWLESIGSVDIVHGLDGKVEISSPDDNEIYATGPTLRAVIDSASAAKERT